MTINFFWWGGAVVWILLLLFYVCTLFVNVCCLFECPQRPVNGIGSPEAKVIGSYKLPDVGAGNKTLVF